MRRETLWTVGQSQPRCRSGPLEFSNLARIGIVIDPKLNLKSSCFFYRMVPVFPLGDHTQSPNDCGLCSLHHRVVGAKHSQARYIPQIS